MWHFEQPPTHALPDTRSFLHALNVQADFFSPAAPVYIARAPGRLDLMGGIADYSGSLVLELPLAAGTYVAAQLDDRPMVTVRTVPAAGFDGQTGVEYPLREIVPQSGPLSYADANRLLAGVEERRWTGYVAGAVIVLNRELGVRFERGLRLLVCSEVPLGKGVSSSAALEVATLAAVAELHGLRLAGREAALLCQRVENRIVGAPCGVMDQMTAACGEQDRLLALLCQPAELLGTVPLPPNVEVWGVDSGIRHAVTGADYGSVRTGAFMGYRIIAECAGLPCRPIGDGRVEIDDPRWRGYLVNVTPSRWESDYRQRVPEVLTGAEFLHRYGGLPDPVTRVDPARTYAVCQPTAHPIYEHYRVALFQALLRVGTPGEESLGLLGELMYQSHASYSACGLGSDGTDRLVELVRQAGPARGLYGAKITGGGSGGTVAVLAGRHSLTEVRNIARQYERETGRPATILGGSSPGAVQFGVWRLTAC